MSTFKIGDRVRHRKFGAGVVTGATDDDDPGMIAVRFDGWDEYEDAADYHPIRESAIWHDPPSDTRKRLREYTDLADDDVVVIAGVPLTMRNGGFRSELRTCALGYESIADFFVDEVRRKPRTKKRRVYEEVDTKEAIRGDIVVTPNGDRYTYCAGSDVADGEYVLRLVEETEVQR